MLNFWYGNIGLVILLALWVLPWKGYALWLAAQRREKWWFIILLIINTLSLLEIYYIFFVVKKKPEHIKHVVKHHLKKLKK